MEHGEVLTVYVLGTQTQLRNPCYTFTRVDCRGAQWWTVGKSTVIQISSLSGPAEAHSGGRLVLAMA